MYIISANKSCGHFYLQHFRFLFAGLAQEAAATNAGIISPSKLGVGWRSLVKKFIFEPLGMDSSFPTLTDLQNADSKFTERFATPCSLGKPIEILSADVAAPAGSIISSVPVSCVFNCSFYFILILLRENLLTSEIKYTKFLL